MGIFLRQGYNVKPVRWGSNLDIQRAVMENCEKIYGIDSSDLVLALPLFWGQPCYDYSIYGNNGINNGAVPSIEGFDFNGSSSDIQITNSVSLNPSYISILAKIKTSASGAHNQICSKDKTEGTDQRVWQFKKSDLDVINLIPFNAASSGDESGTTNIADGVSHHVVGTWDGAKIQVYVDGKVDGSGSAFAGTLRTGQTNDVFIGRMNSQIDHYYFDGFIDLVHIFSIALEPNQIALFNGLSYGLYQPVIPKIFYFTPISSTGVLNTILPIISVEIEGTVEVKSLNATLPVITADLKGSGILNAALPIITSELESFNDGNLDVTLPVITTEITGFAGEIGEVSVTLPLITADVLGGNGGFLDTTLPSMTADIKSGAQLDVILPVMTAEGQAYAGVVGELSVSLPKIEAEAAGKVEVLGNLDAALPMVTAKMASTVGKVMSLNATLPMITAELAGYQEVTGDLNVVLPMIAARLVGTPARFEDCVVLRYEEPNL